MKGPSPTLTRMPSAEIQALIFDFDGTIFDTETPEFTHWQALYTEHGRELNLEDWQRGIGTWGAFDPWAGLPGHVQAQRDTLQVALRDRVHAELQDADLRRGVRGVLEAVAPAGLKLGLASSSDRAWIDRWLTHHGLRDLFATTATQDDVARVKPDPELYLLAARTLGVRPEHCLAVEDSLNGATAAVAAGMNVIVVPHDITRTQPFPPTWPRLDQGFSTLDDLLRVAGVHAPARPA